MGALKIEYSDKKVTPFGGIAILYQTTTKIT
jgi:hypothetical protein